MATAPRLPYVFKLVLCFYLADQLIKCVTGSEFLRHAALWALAWMNDCRHGENAWHPNSRQLMTLLQAAENHNCDCESIYWLTWIFAEERTLEATDSLLMHMANSPTRTFAAIARALGMFGSEKAVKALINYLTNQDQTLRKAALGGLAQTCTDEKNMQLMSKDLTEYGPWLDPLAPISTIHIKSAAEKLDIAEAEVRQRYATFFKRFGMTFREIDAEEDNEKTKIM